MRVVTLGEIMLRLTPPGVLRLGQAESFEVQYGGAKQTWRWLSQISARKLPL